MSNKKKRTAAETVRSIEEMEMMDLLDETLAMSDAEIAEDIRKHGGDPEAIAARGEAFVKQQLARLERTAWQGAASEKLEEAWSKAAKAAKTPLDLPRTELQRRIAAARSDARFGAPMAAAFRKLDPEKASDDELRELLDAIEAFRKTFEEP